MSITENLTWVSKVSSHIVGSVISLTYCTTKSCKRCMRHLMNRTNLVSVFPQRVTLQGGMTRERDWMRMNAISAIIIYILYTTSISINSHEVFVPLLCSFMPPFTLSLCAEFLVFKHNSYIQLSSVSQNWCPRSCDYCITKLAGAAIPHLDCCNTHLYLQMYLKNYCVLLLACSVMTYQVGKVVTDFILFTSFRTSRSKSSTILPHWSSYHSLGVSTTFVLEHWSCLSMMLLMFYWRSVNMLNA